MHFSSFTVLTGRVKDVLFTKWYNDLAIYMLLVCGMCVVFDT